jgi:hypothetical protein
MDKAAKLTFFQVLSPPEDQFFSAMNFGETVGKKNRRSLTVLYIYIHILLAKRSLDTTLGRAIYYGLDGLGSIPSSARFFSSP